MGGRGGQNPAEYQLNFVKKVSEVGGVDLTEFFENYGFFYVGEFEYEDYGRYHYQMSQEMADQAKAEIKAMNLPKPTADPSRLEGDGENEKGRHLRGDVEDSFAG